MKRAANACLPSGGMNPIDKIDMSRRFIAVCILTMVVCSACMTIGSKGRTGDLPRNSQMRGVTESIPASIQTDRNWVRFEAPDGTFAVDFPGLPREIDDSVDTPIGSLPVTRFKSSTDGCEFDAGYLQRSSSVLAKLVTQSSILNSACDGTAANLGGRVVDRTELTIDGHPSRDVRIQLADHPHRLVLARLVITEERIYHAIACFPEGTKSHQSDGQWFLNSFKFIQ